MDFKDVSKVDNFVKEVWKDISATNLFLMEKGHSKEQIDELFVSGGIIEKLKEHAEKMTPDERLGFWSMNC